MKRERIRISDSGIISVPNNVQMADFEIAELFEVMIPTVRANIRAILKSNVVTADLTNGATLVGNNLLPDYYGLEMVMALAFRIHSKNAEVFRVWIQQRIIRQTTIIIQPKPPIFVQLTQTSFLN